MIIICWLNNRLAKNSTNPVSTQAHPFMRARTNVCNNVAEPWREGAANYLEVPRKHWANQKAEQRRA